MPEMDGFTATKIIRTELAAPLSSIPILAVTGSATSVGMQKCYDCGMNDFISKPYDHDELRKKIIQLTCETPVKNLPSSDSNLQAVVNNLQSAQPATTSPMPAETNQPLAEDYQLPEGNVTDLTHLRKLSDGNKGFIIEMVEMFLSKTPSEIELIQQYYKNKQWDELRQIAHKIKPTFGYIGLKDIQATLAEIESNCMTKTRLSEMKTLIDKVEKVSVKAFKELEEELTAMK